MLISNLRDYSDAYMFVEKTINFTNPNNDANDKKLTFENNASFNFCISKINNTLINNAEVLSNVKPIYNLLEYSKNNSKRAGSL